MRIGARSCLALTFILVFLASCSAGDLPSVPTTAPTQSSPSTAPPRATSTTRATLAPRVTATRPRATVARPTVTVARLKTATPEPPTEEPTAESTAPPTEEPTERPRSTPTFGLFDGSPTPEAKDFEFLDQTDYTDSLGDAVVVGLIKYIGDVPIGSVEIAVELEDADHNLLSTESAETVPSLVQPGGLIPFKAVFFDPPSDYEYYNTTVQGDEVDQFILDLYTDEFDVVQSNLVQGADPATPRLVGKVENTGSTNAEDTLVIAALLDSSGEVVDVDSAYTTLSSISPRDQSAFEIRFENGEDGVDYEIVVTGNKP